MTFTEFTFGQKSLSGIKEEFNHFKNFFLATIFILIIDLVMQIRFLQKHILNTCLSYFYIVFADVLSGNNIIM